MALGTFTLLCSHHHDLERCLSRENDEIKYCLNIFWFDELLDYCFFPVLLKKWFVVAYGIFGIPKCLHELPLEGF